MLQFYRHLFRNSILPFAICLLLASCENDITVVRALGVHKPGIEEGKKIESYLSNDGKLKAKLLAPVMLRYQAVNQNDTVKVEFPNTLHVDFYDTLTTIDSRLDARYGKYLENDQKIFLRDSVVFYNRKGDTLWCNELWWNQNTGTFFTDKPVIISQANPRQKIYGQGLNADQNFKWFTLTKVGIVNNSGKTSFVNVPDSTY